jgi:hypothetical protein
MTYHPEKEIVLPGEIKMIWEKADNAFSSQDYERAYNLYLSIVDSTEQSLQYNARWNFLMADLALHGQTDGWKQALETFANEAPAPYSIRADELFRLLNSRGYKFIATCTQADISGLKPRLI